MSSAGQQLVAGRIPGERIGIAQVTANSGNITTAETIVVSLEVPTVAGRTYDVVADIAVTSSVTDDVALGRIRQTDLNGAVLTDRGRVKIHTTAGSWPLHLIGSFTAAATANVTFVVTLIRVVGTGNVQLAATSTGPSRLAAYYQSG